MDTVAMPVSDEMGVEQKLNLILNMLSVISGS